MSHLTLVPPPPSYETRCVRAAADVLVVAFGYYSVNDVCKFCKTFGIKLRRATICEILSDYRLDDRKRWGRPSRSAAL